MAAYDNRARPSATIAIQNRCRRVFPSVLSGVLQVNQYTVLFGLKATYSRKSRCPTLSEKSLWRNREIFGISEDETPELDHSEDSDNGMISQRITIFLYSWLTL